MEEDQEYTLQGVGERSSSLEGEELGGDYECELMIEALRRELDIVREQLAFVTHQLDTREQPLVTHQLDTRGQLPVTRPLDTRGQLPVTQQPTLVQHSPSQRYLQPSYMLT